MQPRLLFLLLSLMPFVSTQFFRSFDLNCRIFPLEECGLEISGKSLSFFFSDDDYCILDGNFRMERRIERYIGCSVLKGPCIQTLECDLPLATNQTRMDSVCDGSVIIRNRKGITLDVVSVGAYPIHFETILVQFPISSFLSCQFYLDFSVVIKCSYAL